MALGSISIGDDLRKAAVRMRAFAHIPAHHIDVKAGESPETKYRDQLRYSEKLPGWETRVVFIYSVDKMPTEAEDGGWKLVRHLSVQISVPGTVRQGEINLAKRELLPLFDPLIRVFFPLHDAVYNQIHAAAPIPIKDIRRGKNANVHFRTPVIAHFFIDDDDTTTIAGITHPSDANEEPPALEN